MTWHADMQLLRDYRDGRLDPARAASVETHVVACPECQLRAGEVVDRNRFEAAWHGIVDTVDLPAPRTVERVLRRLGVTDHVARLLAVTPALTASWLAAVVLVLAFAVGATHVSSDNLLLFLAIAPLLPLAGVATCYGPAVEPTFELGLSLPFSTTRLILMRAAMVFTTSLLLAIVAGLLLPNVSWVTAAWIVPALAVTLAAIAAGTVVEPSLAFAGIATAWIVIVVAVELLAERPLATFGPEGQITALALAVIAAVVVTTRRDRFEYFPRG
jgi:Putative zinc-finger